MTETRCRPREGSRERCQGLKSGLASALAEVRENSSNGEIGKRWPGQGCSSGIEGLPMAPVRGAGGRVSHVLVT